MSNEVFQMMKNFDLNSVELQLILQCAPVLSDLKISNLLNVKSTCGSDVCRILHSRDISIYTLYDNGSKMSMLLYKQDELWKYLNRRDIKAMLESMGYDYTGLRAMLKKFAVRYKTYLAGNSGFPHEMGLFLGYPAEDVEGFIRNKGKNYLCSGYWKVYNNMAEKKRLFRRFEQAEERLVKKYIQEDLRDGSNKSNLLVAVR